MGDECRVNPDRQAKSRVRGLRRGKVSVVEKSIDVAAGIENADHFDAVGSFLVEDEQSRKAFDLPPPNAGMRNVWESKERPHPRHPGELCKGLLGIVNKAKCYGETGFTQVIGGQVIEVLSSLDGLVNPFRHCRRSSSATGAVCRGGLANTQAWPVRQGRYPSPSGFPGGAIPA